jgi:hypothetical protein
MVALPTPIQPKSPSVPRDDGFRFDDHQGRSPPSPQSREPDPEESVSDSQAHFVRAVRALKDQELMPEGKDLLTEALPEF